MGEAVASTDGKWFQSYVDNIKSETAADVRRGVRKVLANGLVIDVVENRAAPTVAVRAILTNIRPESMRSQPRRQTPRCATTSSRID